MILSLGDIAERLCLSDQTKAFLRGVPSENIRDVDPFEIGDRFQQSLCLRERRRSGSHYTNRELASRLVDAVVTRPVLQEWDSVKKEIQDAVALGSREQAQARYQVFIDRLYAFRVLDPACGSGNFLYLSLLTLKDIELGVCVDAKALGLKPSMPRVGPDAVLGIEIDPYATELARLSVWIGHIQWSRRHAAPVSLDSAQCLLNTIECRDALLTEDGAQAPWPVADVIVGNPPFLGVKKMRRALGDVYCDRLFAAYTSQVPAEADLVCYWFARAHRELASGGTACAGLVATNSIRGGANRRVLEPISQKGAVFAAWGDEPWVLDGAAVRVSLVCWGQERAKEPVLNGAAVPTIHADLTAGGANLTTARRLAENAGMAFRGDMKGGAFDVPGELARQWLALPTNANGRPNADVLRPWANGMDVVRRPSDTWIIDFGWTMREAEASYYTAPYAHVSDHVRPVRAMNKREVRARKWWRHVEPGPGMCKALVCLSRFIVTPMVAKHRLFVWMRHPSLADGALIVIARHDDTSLGVLHSRFHELWALRLGTWLGAGNDPRYTPTTTFQTFPFPEGLTPDIPATDYASDPRARSIAEAARALVEERDRWLNPPELVDIIPEVVPGFPDRIVPKDARAAAVLKTRTLTNLYNKRGTPEGKWLDDLHRALDEAVAAAYGWPADLSDNDVLDRLLSLNHARTKIATKNGDQPSLL